MSACRGLPGYCHRLAPAHLLSADDLESAPGTDPGAFEVAFSPETDREAAALKESVMPDGFHPEESSNLNGMLGFS